MSDKIVIGFHKPEEENGFLSNWYLVSFKLEGILFSSTEQYLMYKKAALFHDEQSMKAVLATDDPEEEQDLGRRVKNYDNLSWSGRRQVIIYRALMAKFGQNIDLRMKLVNTGDAILAECAQSDEIWGIGRSITDNRRLDPQQWKGRNLLGFTLMEVREQLKAKTGDKYLVVYLTGPSMIGSDGLVDYMHTEVDGIGLYAERPTAGDDGSFNCKTLTTEIINQAKKKGINPDRLELLTQIL